MRTQLLIKFKESILSVLPIAVIVLILSFTPLAKLDTKTQVTFGISAIFLIIGITFFNLGADIAMSPMGEQIGSTLAKSKKIFLILFVCFLMGLLITIAEPDLTVLAGQIKNVIKDTVLIVVVGVGVGLFLLLAVIKIIFKVNLNLMLMFFYLMIFAITALVAYKGNQVFLPLSFDSGGVTTGPITVPFIMALGLGLASTIGGRGAKENSFGLISLCSVGPIIIVLIVGYMINPETLAKTASELNNTSYEVGANVGLDILHATLKSMKNVGVALGMIVAFFLVIDMIFIKLPFKKLLQIFIGILFAYFGLVIFLSAAEVGFLPTGFQIGLNLANAGKEYLIIFGFILGFVVVLAEPAVHVLTKQVEEITTGGVSKKTMLIALCIGVGISIGLSMIRIAFKFSILFYLIPGYLISLGLSFFVPKIYTAIAFDSGGVASGPLTSSFILPLSIGAAVTFGSGVLEYGFGIVAMVALTPLITIQLLGFKSVITLKIKESRQIRRIISADDEQIISFM